MSSNESLFAAARAWLAAHYPGAVARELILSVQLPGTVEAVEVRLPLPPTATVPASAVIPDFDPNEAELDVLEALEGKALKTTALEQAAGLEHSQLFRALKKLRSLDPPLVRHHPTQGYYRTDAPPADLAD